MFRESFPGSADIPVVTGCERAFQQFLFRGLSRRGYATTADAAGNVYAERGEGSPVVMVATFVDEGGWVVREVGPCGEGILEAAGAFETTDVGRLLSRRSGTIIPVALASEGGRTTAWADGAGGGIAVADSVAAGGRSVKWGLEAATAVLDGWRDREFEGRLVTAFVTRRTAGIAPAHARPDIVLCFAGKEGDREEVSIPRGAALFDRAQDLLESCAQRRGIGYTAGLLCGADSDWVEEMQLAPPGYQTGMVWFQTGREGEAAMRAVTVLDEALGVLLGTAGDDDAREGHS